MIGFILGYLVGGFSVAVVIGGIMLSARSDRAFDTE